MANQERQTVRPLDAASKQFQQILSGIASLLASSWIAGQLESVYGQSLPGHRALRHGRWKRRKDGTLVYVCMTKKETSVRTLAVRDEDCGDYALYLMYNLTSLHSLRMARRFLPQARRPEKRPEDAVLQNLYGYQLPWRSMRHAVKRYNAVYLISRIRAAEKSKREARSKRKRLKELRAATSNPPPQLVKLEPGLLPVAVPSRPLCPAIRHRVITVVTTAALPWLTGTSINPLLRAAYLERLEHVKVNLMIPWLEAPDQRIVYPRDQVFATPALQETHIREWLLNRLNLDVHFRIVFYPARFDAEKNSIFPSGGFDLTPLIPEAEADIAVLEEPEHLCWYHFGPKWRQVFRLVIGVIHTNYVEYVRRQPVDKGGGPVLAFLLWFVNVWRTRANCDVAIRLSEGVQFYFDAVVCNVHGVAPQFLTVHEHLTESGRPKVGTAPDSAAADGSNVTVKSDVREDGDGRTAGEGNEDRGAPLVFDKGCYFIGKMLWAKGYRELCDLLLDYCKRQMGEEPSPPDEKKRRFLRLPFRLRPVKTKRRGGTGLYEKGRKIGLEAIRRPSGAGSEVERIGAPATKQNGLPEENRKQNGVSRGGWEMPDEVSETRAFISRYHPSETDEPDSPLSRASVDPAITWGDDRAFHASLDDVTRGPRGSSGAQDAVRRHSLNAKIGNARTAAEAAVVIRDPGRQAPQPVGRSSHVESLSPRSHKSAADYSIAVKDTDIIEDGRVPTIRPRIHLQEDSTSSPGANAPTQGVIALHAGVNRPVDEVSVHQRGVNGLGGGVNGLESGVNGLGSDSPIKVRLSVETDGADFEEERQSKLGLLDGGVRAAEHFAGSHANGLVKDAAVTSADVSGAPRSAGATIQVDSYGTGGEEEEIIGFAAENALPVTFHGRRDHAHASLWGYKVFVNPSCSDVLCTTTAEALAMGKFVVIADHPSNIFFAQNFPENTILYDPDVPEEFGVALQRALEGHPAPLSSAQRRMLTWEAATERFMSVAKLL